MYPPPHQSGTRDARTHDVFIREYTIIPRGTSRVRRTRTPLAAAAMRALQGSCAPRRSGKCHLHQEAPVNLDRVLNIALTVAAVTAAAVLVRREMLAPASLQGRSILESDVPRLVSDWEAVAASGIRSGPNDAPVTIVEFMDLECPFCRKFHIETMREIENRFGDSVASVFVHLPIPFHRFALPAARVVECFRSSATVNELIDGLLIRQDSLGLKPWLSYLADVGLRPDAKQAACLASTDSVPAIEFGRAAGVRLGIRGTPAIMINGWLYSRPPTTAELVDASVEHCQQGNLSRTQP